MLSSLEQRRYQSDQSDDMYRHGEITSNSMVLIESADIVVGELTGYYPSVPDVMRT